MATWAPLKKVNHLTARLRQRFPVDKYDIFPGCGGLWEQIPYQNLDPQCECYDARLMLVLLGHFYGRFFTAIILKIKQLSQ